MIVPIEWLNEYININKSPKEIAESFTAIGLLLDKPAHQYSGETGYSTMVLDLEHRMDRSDWLAIIGCARDLSAIEDLELKYPPMYKETPPDVSNEDKVEIVVECPDLVNRFNTRVFKNIKVEESPDWLKNRLEAYGIPSKNNIVDITNYVMVEFGQPMHAQDISKMQKKEIVIRRAREGEEITTLLGDRIKLDQQAFVLTQNDTPTVIGGIVGGKETGVDENTTAIVLDAGNYDQNNVRKTSRQLKIQNETVLRYDKFLHPHLTQVAIERATHLILELAGGEVYFNDDYISPNANEMLLEKTHAQEKWAFPQKTLRLERIKQVGGIDIELSKVESLLSALEYTILSKDEHKGEITVEVPYFRTDVEVEDDLVADVLRILNYKNIIPARQEGAPPTDNTPKIYIFEEKVRDAFIDLGLKEHITSPLVQADKSTNSKQIMLENALNSDQNALRTSIYNTLVPVIDTYKKHGFTDIGVFEIGKIYLKNEEVEKGATLEKYDEVRVAQVAFSTQRSAVEESKHTKRALAGFLWNMGYKDYELIVKNSNNADIFVQDINVGSLTRDSFMIFTEKLMECHTYSQRALDHLPNKMYEDVTLVLNQNEPAGPIYRFISQFDEMIYAVEVVEEYTAESLGENKKAVTFKLTFVDEVNGLNQEKVQSIKSSLLSEVTSEFDVELRN